MSASSAAELHTDPRRVAVVTGGASGIGRAVVEVLLAQGFAVCATDLTPGPLESLKEQYKAEQLWVAPMDVTDDSSISQVAAELDKIWGRVDLLVNSAGVFEQTSILSLNQAAMWRMLDVNLCGTLRCMSRFGSVMERNAGGRIINLSSVSGEMGAALASVYAASKAGVIAVTRSAARELAPKGILVNAIAPGLCDTPMLDPQRAVIDRFLVPKVPLKRLAAPQEIAEVVLFLATCKATYLTGAVLTMDGGMHIG